MEHHSSELKVYQKQLLRWDGSQKSVRTGEHSVSTRDMSENESPSTTKKSTPSTTVVPDKETRRSRSQNPSETEGLSVLYRKRNRQKEVTVYWKQKMLQVPDCVSIQRTMRRNIVVLRPNITVPPKPVWSKNGEEVTVVWSQKHSHLLQWGSFKRQGRGPPLSKKRITGPFHLLVLRKNGRSRCRLNSDPTLPVGPLHPSPFIHLHYPYPLYVETVVYWSGV